MQLYLKETPAQFFSCEICEIFKSTYLEEHLRTNASKYANNKYSQNIHSHESAMGLNL